jgi:small subunit ribosomal protein S5
MTDTTNTTSAPVAATTAQPVAASTAPAGARGGRDNQRGGSRGQRGGSGAGNRGGSRGGNRGGERVKPEFDSKIISIRRVTRVTSGGRRLSFSVSIVAGDRKGRVGVGIGKANDTALAIDKATRHAKKNMIKIMSTPNMSIPHMVEAKYSSAQVFIMPAPGRGIIAGSAVRNVVELSGLRDVTAKVLSGSKNRINIARAAIAALKTITQHPKALGHGKVNKTK